MNLNNMNLLKIFILKILQQQAMQADEINYQRLISIDGVSRDLLMKTLSSMVDEGYVKVFNQQYSITNLGQNYFNDRTANLNKFIQFINTNAQKVIPEIPDYLIDKLNSIKNLKTVTYRADALNGLDEKSFFILKANQDPYQFDNRKLGKSKFMLTFFPEGDVFNYENCLILFTSSGFIKYLGFVKEYKNDANELILDMIIQLEEPISVFDIRNCVRKNFNNSQQKQEFYINEEVKNFISLIKNKIEKGFEIL